MMRKEIQSKITNSFPTQVNLGGMSIETIELEEIIVEIQKLRPNIKSLFLNNNRIDDTGAIFLGKVLPTLPDLSFLDLEDNEIDINGMRAILSFQAINADFKASLRGNKLINQDEAQQITFSR